MNDRERFLAVVRGEKPDYIPIIGLPGASGVSDGCLGVVHRKLIREGMPEWVDGSMSLSDPCTTFTWQRYWGTTAPVRLDFDPMEPARGFKTWKRIEGEFEIIESENGAITRQVIDNDENYIMPEFVRYPVRDRKSWRFYRDRMTPGSLWPAHKIEQYAQKFQIRDKPLVISAGGTWGGIRSMMGTQLASIILYDDPNWVREIIEWKLWMVKTYVFPLIERLSPEIVHVGEDICYKGGLIISPEHFRVFCSPYYRDITSFARKCGAELVAMDNDGNANRFVGILEECGVGGMYPFEPKAGNDLFMIREKHPRFVLFGWLEKEVVNQGNEHLIKSEILNKVPRLLELGRYFPNLEHGMQPSATFNGLCRFMTLLHEVTENPEGEFPRLCAGAYRKT